MLLHPTVERAFHVSMGAKWLSDVAHKAQLCEQFHRLEPLDIFWIEKHEANNSMGFVHTERMPRQNNTFQNNAVWIHREDRPISGEGIFILLGKGRRCEIRAEAVQH